MIEKLKDHGKHKFNFGGLTLRACDCDEDGMIENIDVILHNKLQYCININLPDEHMPEVLRFIFDCLTPDD